MNELKKFKFKRYFFKALSVIYYGIGLLITYNLIFKHQDFTKFEVSDFIIIYIIFMLISFFIETNLNKKAYSFINIYSLFTKMKRVYHIELGYFLIELESEQEYGSIKYKIKCYDQKLFYLKEISDNSIRDVNNNEISNVIKSSLNTLYKERLRKIEDDKERKYLLEENKKKIKLAQNKLEEWDGCLDLQSRRDDKINKIIG